MFRKTSLAVPLLVAALAVLGCSKTEPPAVVPPPQAGPEALGPLPAPVPAAAPAPAPKAAEQVPAPPKAEATSPPTAIAKPRAYDRVTVLTIGISRYASNGIPPVQFADRDSQAFGDILKSAYGYTHVALDGPKATRTSILQTVKDLSAAAKENDALILFYAGHGVVVEQDSYGRTGYLIPYDAELDLKNTSAPEEWQRQAIEMTHLTDVLGQSPARHAVVILDACASGFLTRRGDKEPAFRADQQELLVRRSRSVIAASTENQSAFPDLASGHGMLTSALLSALKADRATSLMELFVAARTAVVTKSKRSSLPQMGTFSFDDGEFVFVPLSIPDTEVSEALSEVRRREGERRARRTQAAQLYEVFDASGYSSAVDRVALESRWRMKVARFEENASLSDPLAMASLSLACLKGIGTPADPAKAYHWARKAFDTGHAAGRAVLAQCLLAGAGVERNSLAAERLLAEPAEPSFPLSAFLLADLLGEFHPDQTGRAEALYVAAEKGGIESATLRRTRRQLKSVAQNGEEIDKIVARLKPLAERGNPAAARLSFEALVAKPNPPAEPDKKLAFDHLTRGAEGGDGAAQVALAREYFQEHWLTGQLNLPKNPAQAFRWAELAMACDALDPEQRADARQIVAISLVTGKGTRQDVGKGVALANQTVNANTKNSVKMTVWLLSEGTNYMRPDR